MLERLEAMGLTAYEAKALDHLLRHGERTGPDLSRETGVPFGRVYDTLNALVERGLALDRGGRPRRFAPVAADAVAGRLLAAQKRRLEDETRRLGTRASELESELSRLAPRAAPGPTGYGVRLGEDAAREFLIEATHEARSKVDAYLSVESIQDEDLRLFEAFKQAVLRGVKTRVLIRHADVEYLLQTPYAAEVLDAMVPHLGERLQVRLLKTDVPSFSLLDARRVLVGLRNPLDSRHYLGVVHMEDEPYAQRLQAHFEGLWRDAELDRSVLQRVLEKMGGDGTTGRLLRSAVRRKAARNATRARRA